jgi:hypothetical protein
MRPWAWATLQLTRGPRRSKTLRRCPW